MRSDIDSIISSMIRAFASARSHPGGGVFRVFLALFHPRLRAGFEIPAEPRWSGRWRFALSGCRMEGGDGRREGSR